MSKKKIYEIAKEIDKTSKEVIEVLTKSGIEVKSHMSSIEDEQIAIVKKAFNVKADPVKVEPVKTDPVKTEPVKREQVKTESVKAEPVKAEQPKAGATQNEGNTERPKKKKIIAVYNSQNSRSGVKPNPQRREGDRRPRPEGDRHVRPQGDITQNASRPENIRPDSSSPSRPNPASTGAEGGRPDNRRPDNFRSPGNRPDNNRQDNYRSDNRSQGFRGQDNRSQGSNRGQDNRGQGTSRPDNYRSDNTRTDRPRYDGGRPAQGQRNNSSQYGSGSGQGYQRNNNSNYNNNNNRNNGGNQGGTGNSYGNRQGRPYNNNRPGQGGQGQRSYQGNGNDRRNNSYQDSDRGGERNQYGRRNTSGDRSMDFVAPETKPESKRNENRHNQNQLKRKTVDKYEEKEEKLNKSGRFQKPVKQPEEIKKANEPKKIEIPESISIHDLAEKMKLQPSVIIKKLFLDGKVVTPNTELDFEQAGEIAMEYDFEPEQEVVENVIEKLLVDVEDPEDSLVARPPVVCVMGHVDHGKTSLLDAIRHTHVIDREAGGITQHIGAYMVNVKGQKITFLDTPGHEAFTSMRMRGANSTDIAILVVAADDGVMPQTIEAIDHAKAAGVEIIVAINKMDKDDANVDHVKQELAEHELIPEDWGGSTICVPVSARSREGIDTLLEMVLLTAEVLELKANPNRQARGLVIEAELDKGKGPVATVLVQKGTLHVGDPVTAGASFGKVRAMMDDKGKRVKEAGPSTPVEILGFSDVPEAGDIVIATESEKEARSFAETFVAQGREKMIEDTKLSMSLDDLYSQIQSGNLKELNLIVKADVQGSVEAVKQSLMKLSNEEVIVKIIHSGVGAIAESDVNLASASGAIIIGFNVRPDATAKNVADNEKVEIKLYSVIYDAIADVERAMKGMLDPVYEEKVIGHAEIRQIFKASGVGNIAGSYVLDGMFQRGCKVRITREGKQIFEGALASLKRFKDDVKEVKAGYECGLVFEDFNDVLELDVIEAYVMEEVPR